MKKASIIICLVFLGSFSAYSQGYGLQSYDSNSSYAGYTLFPMQFGAHLIDNCGFPVNSWTTGNTASLSCYLMPDGSLLFPSKLNSNTTFIGGGGGGGRLELYSETSQLIWRYDYYVPNDYCAHHDVEPLPNGNILVIAWDEIPSSTLISYGRNPAFNTTNFWSERIVELEPVGTNQINTVWSWYAVDHIVQDFDLGIQNYGNPANFPNKLDMNLNPTGYDWLHMNGIEYIEEFDQILVSCRHISEIFVIDHSTTTAEASTGSGGTSGMGGDLLWRYGNPQNYGRGNVSDKVLYGQHDARWIPLSSPSPEAGKITVFNNSGGQNIGAGNTSTADIIIPPVDSYGNWTQPTGINPFSPSFPNTILSTGPGPNGAFSSSNQGGVDPLPNGNMLVTNANQAEIFELDINDNVVWEYEAPTPGSVFKVTRYGPSAPELSTYSLTPGPTLESPSAPASNGCVVTYPCSIALAISGLPATSSSTNSISLTGSPSGGTFSGSGIIGSTFNPAIAGTGIHNITYTYTDGNGCTDSVTESIFIFTISFDFATYNSSTISPKQSITIDVDSDAATSLNIQIISIDGKFWTAEELDVMPGKNHYEIDTSDIPEGMYVISASNNEIKKSHKFIMHK